MEAEERIGETEENMTALQQKLHGKDKLVTTLTEKIDDLENRHGRSNLRIVGLPQAVEGQRGGNFCGKMDTRGTRSRKLSRPGD